MSCQAHHYLSHLSVHSSCKYMSFNVGHENVSPCSVLKLESSFGLDFCSKAHGPLLSSVWLHFLCLQRHRSLHCSLQERQHQPARDAEKLQQEALRSWSLGWAARLLYRTLTFPLWAHKSYVPAASRLYLNPSGEPCGLPQCMQIQSSLNWYSETQTGFHHNGTKKLAL